MLLMNNIVELLVESGMVRTQGVRLCVVQLCRSACGVQVWSIDTVVDGEGESHAGSCRWTESGEGRALRLDQGTRIAG
jgi:hypothetical protein